MNKRTFTAAEIIKFLSSQTPNDEGALDLGGGLVATLSATGERHPDRPSYLIERDGKWLGNIKDADAGLLAEISAILWERYAPFIESLEDDLTPDALKDAEDDGDELTPERFKDKPDDGDPLTPDALKDKPEDEPLGYPGDGPEGEKGKG